MSNEQIREDHLTPPSGKDESSPAPSRDDRYLLVRRFTYQDIQKAKDHLRTLAIFHYIVGLLTALFGLFPGIYVALGVAMASGSMGAPPKGPPPEMGFIFIIGGSLAILFFETFAVCVIVAGRSLVQHKRYIFCFVIAVLLCLNGIPVMILGVFTIVVLVRIDERVVYARRRGLSRRRRRLIHIAVSRR